MCYTYFSQIPYLYIVNRLGTMSTYFSGSGPCPVCVGPCPKTGQKIIGYTCLPEWEQNLKYSHIMGILRS